MPPELDCCNQTDWSHGVESFNNLIASTIALTGSFRQTPYLELRADEFALQASRATNNLKATRRQP